MTNLEAAQEAALQAREELLMTTLRVLEAERELPVAECDQAYDKLLEDARAFVAAADAAQAAVEVPS